MDDEGLEGLIAATERLNSGAPIPAVDPSQIEYVWELLRRIPVDRNKNAIGLTAVCGNLEYAATSRSH